MTRRLLLTYVTFALLILVSLEVPLGYVYHRNEEQSCTVGSSDALCVVGVERKAWRDRSLRLKALATFACPIHRVRSATAPR